MHVDLDDLVHSGIMGLLDAVEKFDAARNVNFSAYAKYRIKCALLDSVLQPDWASDEDRGSAHRSSARPDEMRAKAELAGNGLFFMYYTREMTMKSRVSQTQSVALKKLAGALQAQGHTSTDRIVTA